MLQIRYVITQIYIKNQIIFSIHRNDLMFQMFKMLTRKHSSLLGKILMARREIKIKQYYNLFQNNSE